MSIFALGKVDEVKDRKIAFYKLIVNGKCLYTEFCAKIEKGKINLSSLNKIRALMNIMSESNLSLPDNKFNSIVDKGKVVGYEFKDKLLRLYVIKKNPHVYVVLGGYKNDQKKDIKRFIEIAKACDSFLENHLLKERTL